MLPQTMEEAGFELSRVSPWQATRCFICLRTGSTKHNINTGKPVKTRPPRTRCYISNLPCFWLVGVSTSIEYNRRSIHFKKAI